MADKNLTSEQRDEMERWYGIHQQNLPDCDWTEEQTAAYFKLIKAYPRKEFLELVHDYEGALYHNVCKRIICEKRLIDYVYVLEANARAQMEKQRNYWRRIALFAVVSQAILIAFLMLSRGIA